MGQQPGGGQALDGAKVRRMINGVEEAFAAKDFAAAARNTEEAIRLFGAHPKAPPELVENLHFHLGLAHLLNNQAAEAEVAFIRCITKFPDGQHAARCGLGVGRACLAQGTPEKKEKAVAALKKAATDPLLRAEAGVLLAQLLNEQGKHGEAMEVFRGLARTDVHSPDQTAAAVMAIKPLADSGNLDDLAYYLDHLIHQDGVRNSLAWFANQIVVLGDEAVKAKAWEAALTFYQTVPMYRQILDIQKATLAKQLKVIELLETRIAAEKKDPLGQSSPAAELLASLKPAFEVSQTALTAIEAKTDLDAVMLMRRGRCFYHMNRFEEALLCFRTVRTKHASAADAIHASYAEIIIHNRLKNLTELRKLCDHYLRVYPEAENAELVFALVGDLLLQDNNWGEVAPFFADLKQRFPDSEQLDRYAFFEGAARFQDGDLVQAKPLLEQFLIDHPESPLAETALYYVAMARFLKNEYKETVASCNRYLSRYPNGFYAGDIRYRLAFVDFNDAENQDAKIIRDLEGFLADNPDDAAAGAMLCLLADTYKRKGDSDTALGLLQRAAWSDSPDDIIQHGLDSATELLQARKDWAGIAAFHREFLKRKPTSQFAMRAVSWIAKANIREGRPEEAVAVFVGELQKNIADPNHLQVEFLLDELVRSCVPPRTKLAQIDVDEVEGRLLKLLGEAAGEDPGPTARARMLYARARLAELLKNRERANRFLKLIATSNSQDPSVLSPGLLVACAQILLQENDMEGAKSMFQRLNNRHAGTVYGDAGAAGLGTVELALKNPEGALGIFERILAQPGNSALKQATLGRLRALVALERLEPARVLAMQMVGDKAFRGEPTAEAYLLLARIHRAEATAAGPPESLELLKKAHGIYQRVYVAYQGYPELCAEAYWQAYETANELNETKLAAETLKALARHRKLQDTRRAGEAAKLLP